MPARGSLAISAQFLKNGGVHKQIRKGIIMKYIIISAILALSIAVSVNANERGGAPESLHLQHKDQLLQESITANLLCLEDSELSDELYALEKRAESVGASSLKQSLTAHQMNGTEPAAQLRTFGADGLCVMLDVVVVAQACKEVAGACGPDGGKGKGGKDGQDGPKVMETIGKSMSENKGWWITGAATAIGAGVAIIDHNKDPAEPDPVEEKADQSGDGNTTVNATAEGNATVNVYVYAVPES